MLKNCQDCSQCNECLSELNFDGDFIGTPFYNLDEETYDQAKKEFKKFIQDLEEQQLDF